MLLGQMESSDRVNSSLVPSLPENMGLAWGQGWLVGWQKEKKIML